MRLDFASLKPREIYQWMISTILPRPIAWVSTIDKNGVTNLAPFSFFQGVTSAPPTLMIVPVNNRDGTPKDTVRNLADVPEFVVNLVPHAMAEQMNASAAPLPHGQSEFAHFNIASTPSDKIRPPRVAAAPAAFECTVERIVHIGEGPLAANVIFGRIHHLHIADHTLGPDGYPDPAKLDLIARLGGDHYLRANQTFTLTRPAK
jgi:flavin reductase (DIM6/NTAB) family NADH-FMN oxidoreductase RutF